MIQRLGEPVSVIFSYNHKTKSVMPRRISWRNKEYTILKVGLHHIFYKGDVLYHVFSVETETLFLRLLLDTSNLHWKLEEISDGLPN